MRGLDVVTLGLRRTTLGAFLLVAAGCASEPSGSDVTAFVGAQVWDGTGAEPISNAIMLVRDGRIMGVAAASDIDIPAGATVVDLSGLFVIPGLINTHGRAKVSNDIEAEFDADGDGIISREEAQAIRDVLET